MRSPRVVLKAISKSFFGIKALKNVSLDAQTGECVGLLGENGAGKSTLMKVLSGVWPSGTYEGSIQLDGETCEFSNPQMALDAGIAIIHQELALFRELSVAENIFMGQLPQRRGILNRAELNQRCRRLLNELGFNLDPEALVKTLSLGQRQLVEIAKAFQRPVKVIIFDEPTSALSDAEVETLMTIIEGLKKKNVTCIYISHKLNEMNRICDRVVILRDGETVAQFSRDKGFNHSEWIESMVGRKIENVFPAKRPPTERETLLEVRSLSYWDSRRGRDILKDISFNVNRGEILGIAGLMGSHRTELLLALYGALQAQKTSGQIVFEGREVEFQEPIHAIQSGIALVTEDRKGSGLFLERSVRENLSLPVLKSLERHFAIQQGAETELVDYYCKILRVKTASFESMIKSLSGGNQQKVILARWLATKPKLLLLDEPTRGIDVNAKAEIYYLIRQLVDQGLTIVMVSSELPEIVSLSDRVLVMNKGRITGLLSSQEISQESIMERAVA